MRPFNSISRVRSTLQSVLSFCFTDHCIFIYSLGFLYESLTVFCSLLSDSSRSSLNFVTLHSHLLYAWHVLGKRYVDRDRFPKRIFDSPLSVPRSGSPACTRDSSEIFERSTWDEEIEPGYAASSGNLSSGRRQRGAYIVDTKVSVGWLVTRREVLRGPQPRVASRYGAACRMCQGRLERRASGSQRGRATRFSVGVAATDAAQRPACQRRLAHPRFSSNPPSLRRPIATGVLLRYRRPSPITKDGGAATATSRGCHSGARRGRSRLTLCFSSVWDDLRIAINKSNDRRTHFRHWDSVNWLINRCLSQTDQSDRNYFLFDTRKSYPFDSFSRVELSRVILLA